SACLASSGLFNNISSMERRAPITRGRKNDVPASGVRPTPVYDRLNFDDLPQTARSAIATSPIPAPAAVPFTATTTGGSIRTKCEIAECRYAVSSRMYPLSAPSEAIARRSPPKLKLRPAPVSTTARTVVLREQVRAAASRSIANCRLMVLKLSGRLSMTSATGPLVSTWTLGADIGYLFVRRDRDTQASEIGSKFHLARQTRIRLMMRQLGQQLALVRHGRRQPGLPLGIHV